VKATRRKFLSFLGLAPVAAASQSIPIQGFEPIVPQSYLVSGATMAMNPVDSGSDESIEITERVAREWFKRHGVPKKFYDYHRQAYQRDISSVTTFDADLMQFKSFSLGTKRRLQIERNVERDIQIEISRWSLDSIRTKFKKKFGAWPFWNI